LKANYWDKEVYSPILWISVAVKLLVVLEQLFLEAVVVIHYFGL
jgi:hypothetical protein